MSDVYRPDRRGIGQMMATPEMDALMMKTATDAIPYAEFIAPDAAPYGIGYVDKFEVQGPHRRRISGATRSTADLANTSDHAIAVEWGTDEGLDKNGRKHGRTPAHHVLAQVADHIKGMTP